MKGHFHSGLFSLFYQHLIVFDFVHFRTILVLFVMFYFPNQSLFLSICCSSLCTFAALFVRAIFKINIRSFFVRLISFLVYFSLPFVSYLKAQNSMEFPSLYPSFSLSTAVKILFLVTQFESSILSRILL